MPWMYNPFTEELDYFESMTVAKNTVTVKTDTYSLQIADFGKGRMFVMNSAGDKIFNLPSVGADDVGLEIDLGKIGAGKLTIQAADSDKINDSSAGGTLFNAQAAEVYARARLKLVAETQWSAEVVGMGWITT